MPTVMTLTVETIHRLAPDMSALAAARDLVRKGQFKSLGVTADGTWLMGECQGSGKLPYQVSVDLGSEDPMGRCSCPSRKFPCKHCLGLMLLFVAEPERFQQKEVPAELAAKRAKQVDRNEKKKQDRSKPAKANTAALLKKRAAQKDGLDLLEKLVLDLVTSGQWFAPTQVARMERQAKQLTDAYLPGGRMMLHQLMHLAQTDAHADEERQALGAEIIGQLWATVQKGRNYLLEKLAGDENQAEADAVVEEVLGKAWQLTELKEKGYTRKDISLLELAYERKDDQAREERIETSHLIDLQDGKVLRAVTYRPYRGMKYIPEQPSYQEVLQISETVVYPGFINRRVRWEKDCEKNRIVQSADLARAYQHALPSLTEVLTTFRQQLKHPLAPREAMVLIRCQRVGQIGSRVVVEDVKGARLEMMDHRADYSNVANLVRAAGMIPVPALLVKLSVQPLTNVIVGEPHAALSEQVHLRLGV